MVCEVPPRIFERLVMAVGDLKHAVGQEAAKALLVSLINLELVVFEPETATEDNSSCSS